MKQSIKSTIFKVMIYGLILAVFNVNAFSLIIVNGSESGFLEPERTEIRSNLIEAAGYFLESQSEFTQFSNKIEISEIQGSDYNELREILNRAIARMENAKSKYDNLIQVASGAAYNPAIITELLDFDYTYFQESHSLNSVIINEVESFLGGGDIRGVYNKIFSNTQNILNLLTLIKASVDNNTFPEISSVWNANKSYSENLLFGQSTARIFFNIIGK